MINEIIKFRKKHHHEESNGWSIFMMGQGKVKVFHLTHLVTTRWKRASGITMTQHQLLVTSVHCSPRISSRLVFKCSRTQSLLSLKTRIPRRHTLKCTPTLFVYKCRLLFDFAHKATSLAQSPRQIHQNRR